MKQDKLTISQLAAYADVTIRAVRHYHTIGLLPEPARDESGYRRYGAQAAISLTQIKTLTNAGVPLAQINTVLHADTPTFNKTISEVEANITKDIARLRQTKKQLRQLKAGEEAYVPTPVVRYLNQLRALGISEEMVVLERDGWVLLSALFPERIADWIEHKSKLLADSQIASIYQRYDQARTWDVEDPRIEQLADMVIAFAASDIDSSQANKDQTLLMEQRVQSWIGIYDGSPFPAWKRLDEIIQKHVSELSEKSF